MKPIFRSTPRTRRARPQQHQEAQPDAQTAFFQPKLSINAPGDQYEREADAVADTVVNNTGKGQPAVQRMPISTVQRLATPEEEKMPATNDGRMAEDKKIQEKPMDGGRIQKMDAPKEEEKPVQKAAEEEEPVQKMDAPKEEEKPVQKAEEPVQKMDAPKEEEKPVQKAAAEEEEPVQKMDAPKEEEKPVQKAAAPQEEEQPVQAKAQPGASKASPDFSARLSARKGQGQPLPAAARTQMEQGIGADFSRVRIHTDPEAAEMNKDIHAQAFTHGSDVYFNSGKFNPENPEGKRLLAHELTHVVQQGGGGEKTIQRAQIGGLISAPNPHFVYELDAEVNSYAEVASLYGLTSATVQAANGTPPNLLQQNQRLTVPANNAPTAALPLAGLNPKIVISAGTVPLPFRWSAGADSNLIGRIARGTSVSESGGRVVVQVAHLSSTAQGILDHLTSIGAAVGGLVAGYLPAQNMRDAQHQATVAETDLLARMIWGEQRGQGQNAMIGAAWIVKNRFNAGWGSITDIVTARNQFQGLVQPAAVQNLQGADLAAWQNAQTISTNVLSGVTPDNTNGHLYFGNGDAVMRSMQACRRQSAAFLWGTIAGTNFHHSNRDYTGNCQ